MHGGNEFSDPAFPAAYLGRGTGGDARAFARLLRNVELNQLSNVIAHRRGLWDRSDVTLMIEGHMALASSRPIDGTHEASGDVVESIAVDDDVRSCQLPSLDLLMLDSEGGEDKLARR